MECCVSVLPLELSESCYAEEGVDDCTKQIFQTEPLAEEEPPRACLGEAGRRGSRGCQASPKDTGEAHLPTPPTTGRGMSIGGEGVLIQRGRGTFRGFLKMSRPLGSQGTFKRGSRWQKLLNSGPQHLHYRSALGDPGAAPLLSITGTGQEVAGSSNP